MLRPPFPSESIDEKPPIWGAHRTIFALLLRLNVTKCSFFPYPTIATAHIPSNTPILLPQIRASIANSAPRASEQRIRHEKPTAERDCASPRTAKSNVEHSRARTYFYRYGLRGAFPPFPFQKSRRLSLKTSLFLSKSPQLSRKSADVFLFTPPTVVFSSPILRTDSLVFFRKPATAASGVGEWECLFGSSPQNP